MDQAYQDDVSAFKYIDFLNSKNGHIQQSVLLKSISRRLPTNPAATILDAGCGTGWLAGALKNSFHKVEACDASEFFIKFARANYPRVNFRVADISAPLPYPTNSFDFVILNMVGPDLAQLGESFKNIAAVLKPGGKLLMTIPNPKYTYPAAVWKRGILGLLLRRKPRLIIKNSLVAAGPVKREFGDGKIASFHYNLSDYILAAESAGLKLKKSDGIMSHTDSKNFDLNYQLYRYPLLLLLELEKVG